MRMESVLSSADVVRATLEEPQFKLAANEAFLKELSLLEAAEVKFGRIETKLALLGLPECLAAFKAHQQRTTAVRGAVLARWQGREDNVDDACANWWRTESEFRDKIVSAFRAL